MPALPDPPATCPRYLLAVEAGDAPPVSAVVAMATTPYTGNKGIVGRALRRDFIGSLRMTYAMLAGFQKDPKYAGEFLFSPGFPREQVRRYHE